MMSTLDVATAIGFGGKPAPRQLRLITWKPLPFRKGALCGFASVELPNGLRILDMPVLAGRNGPWAALPAKPELDRDGRRRIDINGKPTWAPVLEWRTRELGDRFSEAVIAAVRLAHADDLD
jgi:hypothetical protein